MTIQGYHDELRRIKETSSYICEIRPRINYPSTTYIVSDIEQMRFRITIPIFKQEYGKLMDNVAVTKKNNILK